MALSLTSPDFDPFDRITSPKFCDPDADVTFRSSDGVHFKVQSKHLSSTSSGFAVPESTTINSDPITLAEPSDVLEILLQFIHPRTESDNFRQPLILDIKPELFFRMAEAAEKYVVFGAMNTCTTRMYLELYETNPLEVLNHCARHGYKSLADKAAPLTIRNSLDEVANKLTHPGLVTTWLKYFNYWFEIPKYVETFLRNDIPDCANFSRPVADYLKETTHSLYSGVSQKLRSYHKSTSTRYNECTMVYPVMKNWPREECPCQNRSPDDIFNIWQRLIDAKIAAIPLFSEVAKLK